MRRTQLCTAHSPARLTFLQQAANVPYPEGEDGDEPQPHPQGNGEDASERKTMRDYLEKMERERPAEFVTLLIDYCQECNRCVSVSARFQLIHVSHLALVMSSIHDPWSMAT